MKQAPVAKLETHKKVSAGSVDDVIRCHDLRYTCHNCTYCNDGTVQNAIIITLAAQGRCEMMTEGRLSEVNLAVFMQAGRNNKNKNMDRASFYVCEDNNAERH